MIISLSKTCTLVRVATRTFLNHRRRRVFDRLIIFNIGFPQDKSDLSHNQAKKPITEDRSKIRIIERA